ncbi:MAG: phosphotransferase, partial [Chitinophagaceae bacterium]
MKKIGLIHFDEKEIKELVLREYGFPASLSLLAGYEELNYRLTDSNGKHFLLKIAPQRSGLPFLEAQIAILQHLKDSDLAPYFQQCIWNKSGVSITSINHKGELYYARLFSFIDGHFWVDQEVRTPVLHTALGSFMGKMDRVLSSFSHPAMHRRYTWDISTALDNVTDLNAIRDPGLKRIAGYFLLQFESEVQPVLHTLPHAYVHNDANDYNVLIEGDQVKGLIDFGDMVYTLRINNLAVACTYAAFGEEDPLAVAARVVKGYHAQNPVTAAEVDLLYYLIAGRLCISVIQSAMQSHQQSQNTHHFITEKNAWRLLGQLIRINPLRAQDVFRSACGFPPVLVKDD